ncbi:hypothetical protein QBC34DRAFT_305332 [Podospora aff. communis PSN243]|uniref:Rhodopsin domain-containing protein n=1 Tax=Podospora aff. communis PSN243 TaxID=3040156 RepID=A0AAV9GCN5_9PEZI|nr:hypothetical protein QBC34DRAFT_305332 [Podospora aff. communis PSN243]
MADQGDLSPRPEQFVPGAAPTPEQLASLPHDSQAVKMNAVPWALNSIASLFLVLRLFAKLWRRKRLWWDDYILIAAWICLIIETSILSAMVGLGFGGHIWDFPMENLGQLLLYINVAGSFSPTAAIWSKTSFAVTLLRFTEGRTKAFIWFLIISGNIFIGLTGLFLWVQCTPVQKSWDMTVPGTCWDPTVLMKYNIFSGSYSAAMDIILALLPWTIIWKLTMRRMEKIGVAFGMSMGIFAGVIGIIKSANFPAMLSPDFANSVDLWIWGNAETAITIIAACIPILRGLVYSGKRRPFEKSLTPMQNTGGGFPSSGTDGLEDGIWAARPKEMDTSGSPSSVENASDSNSSDGYGLVSPA